MPERDPDRLQRERDFNVFVGARVRVLREEHDFSQTYVAQMADMDVTQLSRVESGERGLKLREGAKLATVLHTTVERLMTLAPSR